MTFFVVVCTTLIKQSCFASLFPPVHFSFSFHFFISLAHFAGSVDDSKSSDQQPARPAKKFGLFKSILTKHLNKLKPKHEPAEDEEDEELDLICAYPDEESPVPEPDTESVSKVAKGVTFRIQESDSLSLATKGSIKSNQNFDDFGLELPEVISLDAFKDDEFQNELSELSCCFKISPSYGLKSKLPLKIRSRKRNVKTSARHQNYEDK